ncbi:MAG: hypothetical protein RLZZ511_2107 [Cyanobacteriota bacterium]|jgi:signal transduction histidine kinase/CheY-like chemotaxis protein
MNAATVYLQALQEIVAIGQSTDSVKVIGEKLTAARSHRLLLVDPQQQPIGLVDLLNLLPYISQAATQQTPINQIQPSLIEPLPPSSILPSSILPGSMPHGAMPHGESNTKPQPIDLPQLNHLKDEFLACVTHELRSPLTAVLGLSTLLKDQAIGPLNERQQRYAQLIYNSGRHLIGIVNDMLDLTRLESHQLELNFTQVNIAQVCRNAFEQAQQWRNVEENHYTSSSPPSSHTAQPPITADADQPLPGFELDLAADLDRLVADETRLQQMLTHLLSNALKFTDSHGRIGLRVQPWEGWIAFTVWDTGIGIPLAKQHLIFQKFQQLESPMTRQFEGTGLGLALTLGLARLHGGDISFTSQEDQGSQFTLLLPPEPPQSGRPMTGTLIGTTPRSRADAPPVDRSVDRSVNPPLDPPRPRLALVIESSPHHLTELSSHLTELGYRLAIARSGPDALTKARQLRPGVIFLSPLLPVLSGWDVLTLLKQDPITQRIPVIITGAQNDQHQAEQQADAFLGVPILHQTLADTLGKLTGRIAPTIQHKAQIILYLSPADPLAHRSRALQINHLLHQYNFRVLESHNLEEAEILAKVWKAQVVVLNQNPTEPTLYLNRFITHPYLASLPLITLDEATTQAANQIPDLAVFPCLVEWQRHPTRRNRDRIAPESLTENLLQAVEVAISYAGRPLILATDVAQWQKPSVEHRHEWLNAFSQYIQAAGLRCSIGRSPPDIARVLQTQSVDLLLLHWHQDDPALLRTALKQLKTRQSEVIKLPPTLLVQSAILPQAMPAALQRQLQAIGCTPIAANAPMDDVLGQIRQVLGLSH